MGSKSSAPDFLASLRVAPTDGEISSVIENIRNNHVGDSAVVAHLAIILAESGGKLANTRDVVADVASTGGPTSLSTLLTPLFLRVAGAKVPKIGVPGRPAGGIDCLAQIPGFKTEMSMAEAQRILDSFGYVHFLAQGEAAPLDGRMFKIRQRLGAQAVPELVIASLLAKKLAAGVKYAGLDIRVASHGNFGIDWLAASQNARLYNATASILKIHGAPVLTDGRYPYQPFVGRRESLVALQDLFESRENTWLGEHCRACRLLAQACLPPEMRSKITNASGRDIQQHFKQNLESQGATLASFNDVVNMTRTGHDMEITASRDGFCIYPLAELREALVGWQTEYANSDRSSFPDPVGLVLLQRPGEWVSKGTPLATVRSPAANRDAIYNQVRGLVATPSAVPSGPGIEMIYG